MYLLERKARVDEYAAFWEQFDQVARFLDLTPADRHIAWKERTEDEDFHEWPVPIEHFLSDPYYVGTDVDVRRVVREFLADFWDPRLGYELFLFIAGIGAGKSFSASLSIMYCLYCLSTMKRPQKYLAGFEGAGSLSGDAEIVLMNASAAGAKQASRIVYGEAFNKIIASPYFRMNFEPYPGRASELEFPNHIRFSPGTSQWQSALGYNLFGFCVDEAAFGIESERADYVQELFRAFNQRRRSRFGHMGFGGLYTSPGSEYGFVEHLAAEEWDTAILVRRTTTWESKEELIEGASVFLLDRDPDSVRILERDLRFVKPGLCQRPNGEYVRYKTRDIEEVLRESPARQLAAGER